MRRPNRCSVLALLCAGALAVNGCGDGEDTATTTAKQPDAASGESAPPSAVVKVSANKTHAVQPGDEIELAVDVEGFTLDAAKIGQPNEVGVGHYHVYLGSAASEPLLIAADAQSLIKIPDDVNDGTYSLRVVLHNNDHTPLDPPAEGRLRMIIYRLE